MDIVNDIAHTITDDILPHVSKQMNCCYLIYMVIQASKAHDYAWHKTNWFMSYAEAVLFGFGADIMLAILLGKSSLEPMSVNRSLALIALAWWLINFVPYDVLNKFIYFKVGDIQPIYIIMVVFAAARRIVVVQKAVLACLVLYPGAYIAILAGAIAGNATILIEKIFGNFATEICTILTGRIALSASMLFTLIEVGLITAIPRTVAFAFFVIFSCVAESIAACGKEFRLFDIIHEAAGKIIATRDLIGR